tara:strand:- start:1860 stop:2402 length:543 start_codon:yes stop_codon:yes gene_type:complete
MKNTIYIIISIIFLTSVVSAFGIGANYWDENPLYLNPGENRTVELILQNMVGSSEVILSAKVINGTEIATIMDDSTTYSVPAQTKDRKVDLRIEIPKDTPKGTEYLVSVFFRENVEDEGQMLQMATGVKKSFPVIVGKELDPRYEPPPKPPINTKLIIMIILAVIIVAVVIYFLIRKKRH